MKRYFLLAYLCVSGVAVASVTSPNNPVTPVTILHSSFCPKGYIWVQATVKSALDTDTYIIEDSTGSILLFLPTDELEALPIKVGMPLLVYGKIDISPVSPEKNELYAEKITLFNSESDSKENLN